MTKDVDPGEDLDAFDALARSRGLVLEGDDLTRMQEGWRGLRRMIERLPRDPSLASEPAMIFPVAGTRCVR